MNYYITLIDMENKIKRELKLPNDVRIPPSFHSVFINKKV
jgi:hypothetical protein